MCEKGFDRSSPRTGQQLSSCDETATQHARHFGNHHIVLCESSAIGIKQCAVISDALRHDPVPWFRDDDVRGGNEIGIRTITGDDEIGHAAGGRDRGR